MKSIPTAQWLDISPRKLSEEVRLNRIRTVRIGRLIRFDIRDVIAYAEARKTGGLVPIQNAPVAVGKTPTSGGQP